MTDREPDDLYDALRDRLADYGQEPPAPLWASIRAQLPPPVAQPQLRRRRGGRVALLGLLLLIVSTASWQWWQFAHMVGSNAIIATNSNSENQSQQSRSALPSELAYDSHSVAETGNNSIAGSSNAVPAQATSPAASKENLSTAVTTSTPNNQATIGKSTAPKVAETIGKPSTTIVASVSPRGTAQQARATVGENTASDYARNQTAHVSHVGINTGVALAKNRPAAWPATIAADAAVSGRNAGLAKNSISSGRGLTASSSINYPQTAGAIGVKQQPNENANLGGASAAILTPPGGLPVTTASSSDLTFESGLTWGLLRSRNVVLRQLPWPSPAVRTTADTFSRLAVIAPQRWSVQVLAGPALTYRQLGAGTVSPTITAPALYGTVTSVAKQERSTIGFGAQLQVQRALNGRWAVSTGLGYHEYATSLSLRVVQLPGNTMPTVINQPIITSSFKLRDTYRFLTVPMRVRYQFGGGGPRFRLGLLAGADVALYLGGATTEGSRCGCETQSWGRTGSPYHPLSLAVSLGADLRYRLAPRWELLAQPTASYFITSLTRPASGFAPRYLLGGSTLLGVSYGLH
ncbi:outer membrane beta-barrel protein [Hymenobacter terrenus]|uniref:outer membrane beta-barrel protein n=1 Tax=Hymenobacter terrenus TaxID=1629124 RepID=UPI000619E7ED|nr:outer membrane beta-barrel protein [Hymenobacter terrenus]